MNTIDFYGGHAMSELRSSQGVEVGGEDPRNHREDVRNAQKDSVVERLKDLVDDILRDDDYMRSAHGRFCSKTEIWQWVEDIARREKKSCG